MQPVTHMRRGVDSAWPTTTKPTRVTARSRSAQAQGRCARIGAWLFRATRWALPGEAHCFRQTCSDCRPHERKRIFGLSPLGARRALNRVTAQTQRLLKQFLFRRRYRLDKADSRDMSALDTLYVEAHGAPRSTRGEQTALPCKRKIQEQRAAPGKEAGQCRCE